MDNFVVYPNDLAPGVKWWGPGVARWLPGGQGCPGVKRRWFKWPGGQAKGTWGQRVAKKLKEGPGMARSWREKIYV